MYSVLQPRDTGDPACGDDPRLVIDPDYVCTCPDSALTNIKIDLIDPSGPCIASQRAGLRIR